MSIEPLKPNLYDISKYNHIINGIKNGQQEITNLEQQRAQALSRLKILGVEPQERFFDAFEIKDKGALASVSDLTKVTMQEDLAIHSEAAQTQSVVKWL
ncbi:hypothetical protein IJ670_07300, partial [bacterium]|nr:hypothetical protein [bacterium]